MGIESASELFHNWCTYFRYSAKWTSIGFSWRLAVAFPMPMCCKLRLRYYEDSYLYSEMALISIPQLLQQQLSLVIQWNIPRHLSENLTQDRKYEQQQTACDFCWVWRPGHFIELHMWRLWKRFTKMLPGLVIIWRILDCFLWSVGGCRRRR